MNRGLDDYAAPQHDLRTSIIIVISICSVLQQSESLAPNRVRYPDWTKSAAETMAKRIEQAPAPSSLASPGHAAGRGE
jgi:hypothetical protein